MYCLLCFQPICDLCSVNVSMPANYPSFLHKHQLKLLLLLLLACIVSRLGTAIYYVEDIDSLRFALSATDYDIASFKPHFPGYAVFCFCLQLLYALTGHLSASFSVLGGIAIFLIIIGSVGLLRLLAPVIPGWALGLLLFLNPQLWVMGNSYMPDLLGLGILMCCLYLFAKAYICGGERWSWFFFFLCGILLGVRLSYAPMMIVPGIVLLVKNRGQIVKLIAVFSAAVLLWFVPMIIDTGWHQLMHTAMHQTEGHFSKWGGSVISSNASYFERAKSMFQSAWVDGTGGWWLGSNNFFRIMLSLVSAPLILGGIFYAFRSLKNTENYNPKKQLLLYLLGSLIIYLLWAFFFQNVVFKPRHVMPVVPFICISIVLGFYALKEYFIKSSLVVSIVFSVVIIAFSLVTFTVVEHHLQPSAISQMKDYLLPTNSVNNVFVGSNLAGFYMRKHYLDKSFICDIETDSLKIKTSFEEKHRIFSTEKLDVLLGQSPLKITVFNHDPFVNRMWAHLTLYEYQH